MPKIHESRDYSKFELTEINRNISISKNLEKSMKEHGFLDAYPLHCVRNGNGKLKIKAGHHRFDMAQKLGLPIKYVVSNDTATIHELEKATNKWTLKDYLISYWRAGYTEYHTLKEYHERVGISLYSCISMLGGESAGSHNLSKKFMSGEFEVKGMEHANTVAELVLHADRCGFKWARSQHFVSALSKIVWVINFDFEQLKNKIQSHTSLMRQQATTHDYINMLDTVYNRNNSHRMPLAYLAEECARKRNFAIK
jgi:hypothetical protein